MILKVLDINFFVWGKTYNRAFRGIFLGGRDFFDPKTALRHAQDNLGVKKVSTPPKDPAKCPIICFTREKKIISLTFKISGTLIANV
jgi:hypothetical protein